VTAPAQPSARTLGAGIVALVLAVAFEGMAVSTAMPAAAQDLGQISLYAWAFSIYTLGMVVSAVIVGRVADAIGPVKPLAASYLLFGVGLLLGGLATSMGWLIAARFLQGLGGGGLNLAMTVVIAHGFDGRRQATMMSWISAAWVLPSLVGPALAAWITQTWSWHWVFFAILPVMVVGAALAGPALLRMDAAHTLDEHADRDPAPIWTGIVLALGVALLQVAGQHLSWRSAALFVVAVAMMGLALRRLMPAGFFRAAPGIPATAWSRLLLSGAYFAALNFVPLMLVEERGLSLFRAGLVISVGSLGWTLGSWLQSRPWLRLRRDQIITAGVLSATIGIALLAAVAWWPALGVGFGVLGCILGGLGMGLALSSTALVTMSLSTPAQQGRNNSALQSSETLGISLFTAVAGTIFANLHASGDLPRTFGAVMLAQIAVVVLGVASSLRIGPVANEAVRR